MLFSGTFDTTYALSGIFLWTVFGFLSTIINCDVQRMIKHNPFVFHFVGITSFFFLFTLLDTNNYASVSVVWIKTIFVYLLFVLMTKAKWYFLIVVLALLLYDQTYKKHVAFMTAAGKDTKELAVTQKNTSDIINNAIIVIILLGAAHYMYLQKTEYGSKFSMYKFFFTTHGCDMSVAKYRA